MSAASGESIYTPRVTPFKMYLTHPTMGIRENDWQLCEAWLEFSWDSRVSLQQCFKPPASTIHINTTSCFSSVPGCWIEFLMTMLIFSATLATLLTLYWPLHPVWQYYPATAVCFELTESSNSHLFLFVCSINCQQPLLFRQKYVVEYPARRMTLFQICVNI